MRDMYYRDIKTTYYSLRGIELVRYHSNEFYDYYYTPNSVRYTGRQYVTVTSLMFARNEGARKVRISEMKDKGFLKAPIMYANYSHTASTNEIDCANRMARNISMIDFAKGEVINEEFDVFPWKRFVTESSGLISLSNAVCP